ncbi:MAG TPA: DNA polymerase domain-containing protein [Nitrososphaeraceae archaeon]|nr:DNA polymerase domain-containing protein [Nitrososphaeraceae archaeon]
MTTTTTSSSTNGWLFDVYPQGDRMIFWIKQEKDGKIVRLEDNSWSHSIYVTSDNKHDLASVAKDERVSSFIKRYEFVKKYEKIIDNTKSEVLKLTLIDSSQAQKLAKYIMLGGRFGQFRLYNVDILPAQSYFYEHDIFPLAFCQVTVHGDVDGGGSRLTWSCKDYDDVWSVDYTLPKFKTIYLSIRPRKQEDKLPKFTDKIDSISIRNENEIIEIDGIDDIQILFSLAEMMSALDPDFVFTEDGDSFGFPYLAYRAKVNDCSNILVLGREPYRATTTRKSIQDGTTYFSYGRMHYRPSSTQLFGRVHIDRHNSFILDETGMEGLCEIARICRMPLHKASRATIGRCMSSLQCYHASINDILIPWKSAFAEHFKTYSQLFVADRGGMIFEPRVGVHERVGELDFSSLYPSIMCAKNLSGETVLCACCTQSKLCVPELGWHICEKKAGIVPQSLEILLKKRAQYKQLLKSSPQIDPKTKQVYEARQGSLKWILVTSFGYLGYSNSKFGNIDAHIATCAFDRQVLLKVVRVAEYRGFRILHGIVDSIWVVKQGAAREDYLKLKEAIEQNTGFPISFEGIYKWVAFAHSKRSSSSSKHIPVPNRYFGIFEEDDYGSGLKVRGLEMRRRDNPPFFDKFQTEVLKVIAKGNTIEEVRMLMPQVKAVLNKYVQLLKDREVPLQELVFTKQLSKNSDSYLVNTIENTALRQLAAEGRVLRAGEILQYIITDYYNNNKSSSKRVTPFELVDNKTTPSAAYDVQRYIELLVEVAHSVTEPFNFQGKNLCKAGN